MISLPSNWEMLSALVGSDSISATLPELDNSNEGVSQIIASWAESIGFQVEEQEINALPRKLNLIATLGPDNTAPALILSGHSDTVPCDPNLWIESPFSLTERDGEWYGLGSCDMKGFFVPALKAAAAVKSQHEFKRPLTLLATADEETTMAGVRALKNKVGPLNHTPVLIGEPTGLRPVHLHKGIMMHRIELLGQAGHSSNPAYGHNALEAMHEVMSELLVFRKEIQAQHSDARFDVPAPTMNLGCAHGGDNPNRICGWCNFEHDIRLIPGMDPQKIYTELRQRLPSSITDKAINFTLTTLTTPVPPFDNESSTFVERVEALSGQKAISVNYTTEAPFFMEMGGDVVVCGPGDIAWAHQPEERVHPQALKDMQTFLEKLIYQECCTP